MSVEMSDQAPPTSDPNGPPPDPGPGAGPATRDPHQTSEGPAVMRVSVTLPLSDREMWRRALVRAAMIVPVLLLLFSAFLFGASNLAQARDQAALLDRFTTAVPTGQVDLLEAPIPLGSPVALVEIPALGVRQVVVEGTSPDELKAGPGHLPVSVLPGEVGNSVLMGRRATYGAPFRDLARLSQGDLVVVTTGQGVFAYAVTGTTVVPREQTQFYRPSAESTVTLVTSSDASPWSDRVAVTAALQGAPVGIATRPIATVGDSALGVGGDPLGYPIAIVWGALLVGVCLLASRLYRRWSSLAAYLVTAPLVLILLWFTFENLARVLPGTM